MRLRSHQRRLIESCLEVFRLATRQAWCLLALVVFVLWGGVLAMDGGGGVCGGGELCITVPGRVSVSTPHYCRLGKMDGPINPIYTYSLQRQRPEVVALRNFPSNMCLPTMLFWLGFYFCSQKPVDYTQRKKSRPLMCFVVKRQKLYKKKYWA